MNTKEYHEYQGYHTRNTMNTKDPMDTTEYHGIALNAPISAD